MSLRAFQLVSTLWSMTYAVYLPRHVLPFRKKVHQRTSVLDSRSDIEKYSYEHLIADDTIDKVADKPDQVLPLTSLKIC